ncbi:hypothetical protein FACS1894191_1830 [Clostridia bacterium]|nr:hypothetical protein FACS1894191_1830 [Clostridia bacterium]
MEKLSTEPEVVVCGVPSFDDPNTPEMLRQMKASGVTSIQIYTFWRDYEPKERGKFEWEHYDRQVRLVRDAGLKYVPFILIGPKYASPEWWLNDPNHVPLRCLEHDKENMIDSPWNPLLRTEIDRVLKAFAEHYLPWGILESIQPGIGGDYGESEMPAIGNWPGDYHTHRGFWMADPHARASFRKFVAERYGTIEAVNKAWDYFYRSIDDIQPFLPHKAHSRTALFDELEWYTSSMTDFVDFWMATCRKYFPETEVYMCVGGVERPQSSVLFSGQAKACAKYGGGLRLTNESNKFFDNFFLTSYVHSACEFYGSYFGLEPVGPMTAEGVTARMFGSAVYGNRQIFYYYNNIFRRPEEGEKNPDIRDDRTRRFTQYLPLLRERESKCDMAFFWPHYLGLLAEGIPPGIRDIVTYVRKQTNIMPVNDMMVLDGALSLYKLLLVPVEAFSKREVLLKIRDWVVNDGGKVFAVGQMFDLELENVPEYNELFGIMPDSEKTSGHGADFKIRTGKFAAFKERGAYRAPNGWMNLHPDTIELSKVDFRPAQSGTRVMPAANAFMREYPSGGAAIAYFGPLDFKYDAQEIFAMQPVFPTILSDVIGAYTDSAALNTAPDEVVRGYIDGKLYALYDNGEIEEKADGK